MDDVLIRLKCLEIANAEHPGTRLGRAEELYKWVKSAPTAPGSESSGGPTALSGAENVTASAGFKLTAEQRARLGESEKKAWDEPINVRSSWRPAVDPEEIKRMSES